MRRLVIIMFCVAFATISNSIFDLFAQEKQSFDDLFDALTPGAQDFSTKLPNGYELVRVNSVDIQILLLDETSIQTQQPSIPAKVVEISVVNDFVAAKRQGLKRRRPNNPDDTYMEEDPEVFDYWILDTKTPVAHGPFNEQQFKEKADELSIGDEINWVDIYEFAP
ncbi:DUF3997 domain-containing protein [Cyanothece sp. BG0011]|uniref:DUF3997 domain-containing protein n=1 Tax=Cyanothece sp. BG0011 TaxID=2082950 RepID=UPI000D1EFA7F|nr:DUF3997 domain-containing protein [Cyanothece sp. BG0011]